jgi:hypothetical protein
MSTARVSLFTGLVILLGCAPACTWRVDYGDRPHLLGQLAKLDVHMLASEVAVKFPELMRHAAKDFEDGRLRYRVWFDDSHHVESLMVFVDGPIDRLLAAWGPGAVGDADSKLAHFYTDAASGTQFEVRLPPEDDAHDRFIVVARPYRPLASLFDGGPGVALLGMDVLGAPIDEVVGALARVGVHTRPVELPADLAAKLDMRSAASATREVTEHGRWELDLRARTSTGEVLGYRVEFLVHGRPGAKAALNAFFDRKWGAPVVSGPERRYPGTSPRLVVTELELGYVVEVDR